MNRLRVVADPYLSWVACVGSDLVGHVLFTPIAIRSEEGVSSGMGLAPLAVSPAWQRRGVGSALVRAGLDACRRASQRVVVVLGDPRYYGRFGFEPAAASAASAALGPNFLRNLLRSGRFEFTKAEPSGR